MKSSGKATTIPSLFAASVAFLMLTFVLAACNNSAANNSRSSNSVAQKATATATLVPTATPTKVPATPTPRPQPTATTPPPPPSGPPIFSVSPQVTYGLCGTQTSPGRYPPVTVANLGGGILKFFVTIPAQLQSLNQHYKLTFAVYGPASYLGGGDYELAGGKATTVQLYQSTPSGHATELHASIPHYPMNSGAYLYIARSDNTQSESVLFHCTNY